MAKLIYSMLTSLDGYTADVDGNFDWAAPDAEVHAFVNDQQRPIGTYLYGRRLYETMVAWETMDAAQHPEPEMVDFGNVWRAADKVVYSTTLDAPSSARTRVERTFEPEAVRQLKAEQERDLVIGGPGLAAEALRAGLVDELQLYLMPAIVGGGTRVLPGGVRLDLTLIDERRFDSGAVYVRYRCGS